MHNGTATAYESFRDKVPPQNLEAESSVLGAVLLEPQCLNDVMALLKAEDFYLEGHRRIFRASLEMSERNQPIDTLTLGDYLKTKNELEAVGGSAYLCTLAESVPTAVNVLSYAKIVKRESQLRSLTSLFMEAAERGYTGNEDPLLLASTVCAELLRINPTSRPHVSPIGDLMTACLKDLDNAYQSKGRIIGVPTGLEELERYYGGISKDDLIVVGGRTSQGKTGLAGTIAKNAAARGHSVAFVSAESDPKKIAMRLLSQASQVENVRLQVGVLAESDFPKIIAAAGRLRNLPMWFIGGLRSWEMIKAQLRALKLREPSLSLVVIDYAQLLQVQEKERRLQIAKISAESKGLAMEFNAAVILLSQISRDVEKNQAKQRRPKLSDLLESSSLEQDADMVFLIHRERLEPNEPTELIIAKNREGRIGTVELRFDEKRYRFRTGRESLAGTENNDRAGEDRRVNA